MKFKGLIIYGVSILVFLACSKQEPINKSVCGVINPVSDLPWLKEFTEKMQKGDFGDCSRCTMYLEKYNSRDILVVENFPDDCVLCQVRECDGSYVKFKNFEENQNFINGLRKDIIVWKYKP
ncbi:hypothetical protein VB776_02795 [Arcicella sp. DC2W]|uniref:Lipoprotein n=1 Tax=Arcicella gelida TaxID=2984195 RepID=A0ABU5S015_9BACT|nr:hypothetical protein [Arcicella sp. DC2W]MEA5401827.1 hypothetical protein [Arcicella sp. DC2W]